MKSAQMKKGPKYPQSVQLFKFCHKIMTKQTGKKVRDQDIGSILGFNPSDCSHWKKGEKHIRSIFSIAALAEKLKVDQTLVSEVASGAITVDDGLFEYNESEKLKALDAKLESMDFQTKTNLVEGVKRLVSELHQKIKFQTPPLYIPEIISELSFVNTQPIEIFDRLSRVLVVKENQYLIQYQKGELSAQTRMSVVYELAKVFFKAERARYPYLGEYNEEIFELEQVLFAMHMLVPQSLLRDSFSEVDPTQNMIIHLAKKFWAPKILINYQLKALTLAQLTQPKAAGSDMAEVMKDAESSLSTD